MKKKLKGILILGFVMVMLLSIIGCKKDQPASESSGEQAEATVASKPVTLDEEYVYLAPLSNLEYWQAHRKGLEDACAELGVKASFVGDNKLEATAMCTLLETLIVRGVDGIVMQGNFPDAYIPLFEKAWDAGIPIVTQTVDVPNSKRLCFLGTDYVKFGENMLELAAEASGGKGDVIISTFLTAGSLTVEDILTGIHNAIKKYPKMRIVAEVDDKADIAEATVKIGSALQANPNVAVIIGGQSVSGLGAVTAVREAGKEGQIKIISIDRDAPTLEAIQNGEIYATVAGKQYTEVYYGVKLLYDFHHGSKRAFSNDDTAANILLAPSFIDTGVLIINKDNVEKFVNFKYYD